MSLQRILITDNNTFFSFTFTIKYFIMVSQRKVPGVYIKELHSFPNSVVAVETALPVFIGYTERVNFKGVSLQNKPIRIESLRDYTTMFGAGAKSTFKLNAVNPSEEETFVASPAEVILNGEPYRISIEKLFYMYNSLRLFFANGGRSCYIMSIGTYEKEGSNGSDISDFINISLSGISKTVFELLEMEQGPTMILIPDALSLPQSDYYKMMNLSLEHCGKVQSRITLIDAYIDNTVYDSDTFVSLNTNQYDPISVLRNEIESSYLSYGVAYYPWLNTNVVSASKLEKYDIISNFKTPYMDIDEKIVKKITSKLSSLPAPLAVDSTDSEKRKYNSALLSLHNKLKRVSPNYSLIIKALLLKINCLPATSAVAGCIAFIDSTKGVWKAPANIALKGVHSPVINISSELQSKLNVDSNTGKSVNAIRPFTGNGVLIWGARTLDGNSQDWRYVNVRRTLIMLEQSIKLAVKSYVFAANDANTWINLKSEIENFLTGIWKQGGLAGSKPEEAFCVMVGLGSTMTAQDILDGYLNLVVLVAATRPAEFIEISFRQQLQQA